MMEPDEDTKEATYLKVHNIVAVDLKWEEVHI
jgi:hypothetical protein